MSKRVRSTLLVLTTAAGLTGCETTGSYSGTGSTSHHSYHHTSFSGTPGTNLYVYNDYGLQQLIARQNYINGMMHQHEMDAYRYNMYLSSSRHLSQAQRRQAEANLRNAQARLAQERANLARIQADRERYQRELDRQRAQQVIQVPHNNQPVQVLPQANQHGPQVVFNQVAQPQPQNQPRNHHQIQQQIAQDHQLAMQLQQQEFQRAAAYHAPAAQVRAPVAPPAPVAPRAPVALVNQNQQRSQQQIQAQIDADHQLALQLQQQEYDQIQ